MATKKNDPYGSDTNTDDMVRRRARLDNELQPDPELNEGSAGGGRIALFAIAIVAILGAVFYGLNNPSVAPTSTAQTTTTVPATPPAGQTTGSAATSPTSPPVSTPPAVNQPGSGSSSDSSNPSNMTPAPSPSNGGTTQSGSPANN